MAEYGYSDAFPAAADSPPTPPILDSAPGMSYAGMQQPLPPQVEQMARPAATPQEVEVRKQGWMQVVERVQSDPNLMRAIGIFGAQMLQPMQGGESGLSRFATSALTGQNAYAYGQEAERQRARQGEADAMQRQRHDLALRTGEVGITSAKEQIETTRAQRPGIVAASNVAAATEQDAIDKFRLERQKTEQLLKNAAFTGEREQIALARDKEEAAFIAALDPSVKTARLMAEYKKPIAELGRIEQQTATGKAQATSALAAAGASSAQARENRAEATLKELRVKDPALLTPGEKEILAREGARTGGATSGEVQKVELYKSMLRQSGLGLSEEEVNRRGADMLINKKTDPFGDYLSFRESDKPGTIVDPVTKIKRKETEEEHRERFFEMQRAIAAGPMAAKKPEAAPGAPNPAPGMPGRTGSRLMPTPITSDAEFAALPKGSYFITPDGKTRGPKP